ncbi:hypothetical protein [Polaribacter sp.]|uniref:hypothetical protein n=1 Tax=Polaribacter sp. TaxID=1920175 RepID=UPI003F6C4EA9
MRKYTIVCFLWILLISCDAKNETIFLHSLNTENIEKLTLHKSEKDQIFNYSYTHPTDSIKNLNIAYHPKNDWLMVKKDTFISTPKRYITKNYEYNMYQNKEVKSHHRTLVFNKKYGLLCSTGFGADFLFFKDSLQLPETKMIFKEIILELNKINLK